MSTWRALVDWQDWLATGRRLRRALPLEETLAHQQSSTEQRLIRREPGAEASHSASCAVVRRFPARASCGFGPGLVLLSVRPLPTRTLSQQWNPPRCQDVHRSMVQLVLVRSQVSHSSSLLISLATPSDAVWFEMWMHLLQLGMLETTLLCRVAWPYAQWQASQGLHACRALVQEQGRQRGRRIHSSSGLSHQAPRSKLRHPMVDTRVKPLAFQE